MSIAIIDMICYHTKNKNMLEYVFDDIYEEDMKKLVNRFFDCRDKQCTVQKDENDDFFIERDNIDNGRQNEYYACLKKIIFKKNGNIDVEMCIGDDEIPYTVNIKEYKTIQPTNDLYQEYSVWQPFNWKNLNQGDLTKDNVLNFLNSSPKLNELKNKIINQLATVLYTELNKKTYTLVDENNSEDSDNGIKAIKEFSANNNNLDIANANISSLTNKPSMVIDPLEAQIKQTLEEFMSDIELTQPTQGNADIVIKNKKFVDEKNNKITEINISPNKDKPRRLNDVKFNIFINGKKYSISREIDILPFVQNDPIGLKVCKDFLKDVNEYFQDKNNKKKFVEKIAEYVKTQIEEKQTEKEKQINENNEDQNDNIINQIALSYKNNNVVTDKQKNSNENITNDAEDIKNTALNTNNNNENDTYHNEDHYIARKIRNCLSTIDCCNCLSLDTGSSIYWQKDNSPFIFE